MSETNRFANLYKQSMETNTDSDSSPSSENSFLLSKEKKKDLVAYIIKIERINFNQKDYTDSRMRQLIKAKIEEVVK